MNYKRLTTIMAAVFLGVLFISQPAHAKGLLKVTGVCQTANKATLMLETADGADIDGVEFYRADTKGGKYQYVGEEELDDLYYYDYYTGKYGYSYTDPTVLNAYQNYYYQIKAYHIDNYDEDYDDIEDGTKEYVETVEVSVYIVGPGPSIKSGKRSGKNAVKLTWNQVAGADGYMIYYITDMDKKGNMIYPDIYDESKYTLAKQIKNNKTLSVTFKKLTYGVTYTYRIYAYKNVNGSPVKSISSQTKSVAMDYYAYAGESYSKKIKRAFGSEKKRKKNFSTEKKARKQMKTIKIKVWDYKKGKKGKKITKTKYITVNKNLAPTIKQIFKDIYNSKEKQVIHDIGCYSYRTGEHMYGLAIDVNPNENYMIDGKKILAGKFWKPKKNPYSIPNNSEFVKIMNRYGFYRGDWGKRKDYMHFSYFGT